MMCARCCAATACRAGARRWPRRPVPPDPAQIFAEQLVTADMLAMTLPWRRAGGLR
jgi:hypothetical protein